jgi:thioredoxin 1
MALMAVQLSCTPKSKSNSSDGNGKVKSTLLNPNDFEAKMASTPNAQIIDVRTPGEFGEGYIKGAININYQGDSFADEIAKLDKSKPTFVYCRSGGRSAESCSYMANQGFTTLYELDGGISSWQHANKPIEH